MKILVLLLFMAMIGCSHTGVNELNPRSPATVGVVDPGAVQTAAVTDSVNLFLPDRTDGKSRSLLSIEEGQYDQEVAKGNICLGNIETELKSLKEDSEMKDLCRRFKSVNDYLSGKPTACFIGYRASSFFLSYSGQSFFAAPYVVNEQGNVSAEGPYVYNYSYNLTTLSWKMLDKKSYAAALAADRCHIDRNEIVENLREYVEANESVVAQKQSGQRDAKSAAEAAQLLQNCKNSLGDLKQSVSNEVSRIERYIPQSWLNSTETSAISDAKADSTHGKPPAGNECFDLSDRLRTILPTLKAITGRKPGA